MGPGRRWLPMEARVSTTISNIKGLRAPDGAAIEYEVIGSGEPLVMLHGTFVGVALSPDKRSLPRNTA